MRKSRRKYDTFKQCKRNSNWQFEQAVRELLQNPMDHLKLLDSNGVLRKDVKLRCEQNWMKFEHETLGPLLWIYSEPEENRLRICQWYTTPLDSVTLIDGVPNLEKDFKKTAGGFGKGFKDAAIAVLANNGKMEMRFDAVGQDEDENDTPNGAHWTIDVCFW